MSSLKITRTSAIVALGVSLAACHGKMEPSQENFNKAVQSYLDGTDAVCVVGDAPAPFDVANIESYQQQRADQLVKVGLLSKQPVSVRENNQNLPGARYTLTEAGEKASRGVAQGLGNRFCGGKAKLVGDVGSTTVDKDAAVGTRAFVRYVVKLVDRPTWDDESVLAHRIELATTRNDQFQKENFLVLTADGWKVDPSLK
ncbi:hypothetical protein LJR267_009389 [Paraburkholderia hospita]